ncbi:tyrosinase family protein [Deinococcus yavapaiensis]|uniref:Tyrosinase n=1 Tax=Deinococcus yavapaiensis KR-236 TaxID=694435 RepID=A0A318S2J3_9DEIO|nr:tyrosinase family protein [Deinococcus yavapaiensis]PYE52057.1 tyrosinase [Deinococcus yavapaiensis KR-236]
MFERRDVWVLSANDPWDPILTWYARAVQELRTRLISDPTSWGYLAAMHGTDQATGTWPKDAPWNACQHNSWYFLPWHRMYLHYFETVVRQTIIQLGGPADWALPYWDYSDTTRLSVLTLPTAFREPSLPSGDVNPLFVSERAKGINAGGTMPKPVVSVTAAMNEVDFSNQNNQGLVGFGGPITGWNHDAPGGMGALELRPHGTVHMAVGGTTGWMSHFNTAALDPIFWLHHANIDRLWEAWLRQGVGRANPTKPAWLNMQFTFGSGPSLLTMSVADVRDASAAPLSYQYTDLNVAALAPLTAGALPHASNFDGPHNMLMELVGASEQGVPLTNTASSVVVPLNAPASPGLLQQAPQTVQLKIENVRGSELAAANYLVHVNMPAGAPDEEQQAYEAGVVTMFGVRETSRVDDQHSGSGLTVVLDITDLARRLQQADNWNAQRLHVTFTPLQPDERGGNVTVGRVSVLFGGRV